MDSTISSLPEGIPCEALLDAFYDSSPHMMGIVELIQDDEERDDLRRISCNQATARFLGTTPEEYRGTSVRRSESANDLDLWRRYFLRAEQTGQPVVFEYPRETADDARWLSVRVFALNRSAAEGRRLFCFTAQDMTDYWESEVRLIEALDAMEAQGTARTAELTLTNALLSAEIEDRNATEQRLRESREQFRFLADMVPQIVWTSNADGNADYYNERWFDYTGLTREQTQQLGWRPAMHPDDVEPCLHKFTEAMTTGRDCEFEYRLRRGEDGSYRWHLGRTCPMRNAQGEIVKWFGTGTDIEDYKQAQAILYERNATLETDIQARMAELEQANAALQVEVAQRLQMEMALSRSNKELEQFASIASHDLQEPLRKILTFSRMLQSKHKGNLDESARDYLERMEQAAQRMQTLVNDLLALSRISRRAQPCSPVDLNQVAAGVLEDLESRIEKSSGHVVVESLPSLVADPGQMRQLLLNLVGNSLKYHKPEVPPEVRLYADTDTGTVSLHVTDNGIGFSPEDAHRIFEPFHRLVGKSEYEGNGIGLSIVQKIVERHQGSIQVNSTPGMGTTFTIRLPRGGPGDKYK